MNTEQNSNPEITEGKARKSIERSAAYPAYSIEYCLSFTGEVYKHFRNSFAKRDDILSLIKGAHPSKIAACGHYGFLEREKDTYKVSELYKKIVNHLTPEEKAEALLKAFITPTLNADIVEKFDGDILPQNLHIHLFRFHRISEGASQAAADVFISNAQYVGVLSDSNKLCYNEVLRFIPSGRPIPEFADNEPPVQVVPVTSSPTPATQTEKNVTSAVQDEAKPALLLTEIAGEERLPIKLTEGKRAYLSYPKDLKEKDITILKLQLEALALTL
ncbi:hypothetical protein CJD36_007935 [Flavipsychrobacter stenotrophus]|uniref:Uncharacterized protein n=1 Tax=Flavipsychrobacter stenotrophus TaxID=2077091 RepID=A0A2S7SYQ4_9BACT|nr:hypothetical protein [Flavipsychrobacter stenotrophus]PQJ11715.1 hypothetical protein CJD36_007935 [Flavipsychrobacter stenotrophus]